VPCNTIQINRVDIRKLDPVLLAAVISSGILEADGYTVAVRTTTRLVVRDKRGQLYTYDAASEEITSQASTTEIARFRNTLMKAYSKQAIFLAAKRNGWKVRQVAKDQYEVQR
jgi:hypothetical protein